MSVSFWAIRCVWLRYFEVFRRNLAYALLTTFIEPILYLLSFGFGVGSLVPEVTTSGTTLPYRAFILSGIVAQTVLFQGFFEAGYGGFVRMYYQKVFTAIATTPVTLSEVLWGELFWDASRATLSASAVLLIGFAIGDFTLKGCLITLPVCFASAFLFAGMGLWSAAKAHAIEQLSYPQYLAVFPMFLFCGIYFPLETLPQAAQTLAWFLPLTSVASSMRTLLLGLPFNPLTVPIAGAWLIVLVAGSRYYMAKRLIK